uniref:Uncharacterized protein n=1 Tax=Oryza barthii TaxID=65489 RepID=A0A0D3H1B7_9ORYZ
MVTKIPNLRADTIGEGGEDVGRRREAEGMSPKEMVAAAVAGGGEAGGARQPPREPRRGRQRPTADPQPTRLCPRLRPTRHPGSSHRLRLGLLPTSHPYYAIDRASAAFITRRLNAWDWGPMSNGGNRRLVTIKSSVQQAGIMRVGFY